MLWTKQDTHDSNWRVREFWKYATAMGVNGTPTLYVNGVRLVEMPWSLPEWTVFINNML